MKKLQYICIIMLCVTFGSCDRHDKMDEILIVGKLAPQVYWEVGSTTVTAGNTVQFAAQYYTTGDADISHLEAWYDVFETIEKNVTCPWTESFSYGVTSMISERKRIAEKIIEYPHNESYWVQEISAYNFSGAVPTSTTLSNTSWRQPSSFDGADSVRMAGYFGDEFMQQFKDSLYNLMTAADFKKMYQGLNLIEDFTEQFLDSTQNANSGRWEHHFPKVGEEYPVPEEIKTIWSDISFADLIFSSSTGVHSVEYSRSYSVNAFLKVLDKDGNTGMTTPTVKIELN